MTARNTLWHLDAACVGADPEVFFPLDLAPVSHGVAAAKRICALCPVQAECLADVMIAEDPARRWGISAGTTPAERAALFAAQRQATPAAVAMREVA
ncbi:WhiB family transcriptional regulator [Pseudonocardia alaniniphila]|uniref:WhiB family transcriptional regulator n=1 Tax=Pseudonocardia alaniniphila TaxID=75291 RepID=A0ABS9TER7_9PSEU|nr:WhiB family transcriptional regulator [Pseudonocardia alaniniphila]MCH6167041.1 WhiB family transcriptional regulator [Pseudonocardia alaniniphila]